MQIKKIVGAALCASALCFTPVQTAIAAEPYSIIAPLYDIAGNAWCNLRIDASNAYCKSSVDNSSAVKITAVQTLERQGFLWIWSTYDNTTWTKTVYSNTLTMSNTKTGLSGGKYRLKTEFTLTDKNGETETITIYSDEKSV